MEDLPEFPQDPFGDEREEYQEAVTRLNRSRQDAWIWDYESAISELVVTYNRFGNKLENAFEALQALKKKRRATDVEAAIKDDDGEVIRSLEVNTSDLRHFKKLARSRRTAFDDIGDVRTYYFGEMARQLDRTARMLLRIKGATVPKHGMALRRLVQMREDQGEVSDSDEVSDEQLSDQLTAEGFERTGRGFAYQMRQTDVRTFEVRGVRSAEYPLTADDVLGALQRLDATVEPIDDGEEGDSDLETFSPAGSITVRIISNDALFDLSIIDGVRARGEVRPFASTEDLGIVDDVFEVIG